uniref:Water stress and hypersensitive response domain-containing protein n=1 Tax=Fagus sylvatica TaxID=28930 RepID=A0A2N9HPB6_FAGSY
MASSNKPEVVEKNVKGEEHKEDEKDKGKGAWIENVWNSFYDFGMKKIEGAFGKPTAKFTGIHIPFINREKADIVVDVLMKNPSLIPIPLTDINFLIESDERNLISGGLDAGTIPAYGEVTVKVRFTLIYDVIKHTVADIIKPGSKIPYKIKVDVPFIGRQTTLTGEINIPDKPAIHDIEDIKFERISFEETVAFLHLKLENKNDSDLSLKDHYAFRLFDVSIGVEDLANSAKLDKNGITHIDISITFSLNKDHYEVRLCDMIIGVADLAKSSKLDKNGITITFRPNKDFGSALRDWIKRKCTGYMKEIFSGLN